MIERVTQSWSGGIHVHMKLGSIVSKTAERRTWFQSEAQCVCPSSSTSMFRILKFPL